QEEVAGVLTGAQVDDLHPGGDAADAQPVERGGDGGGDVGAVVVLIHVSGVLAGAVRLLFARPVHGVAVGAVGDVGREVTAQLGVEVGRDVGVGGVDAGVEDADEHI